MTSDELYMEIVNDQESFYSIRDWIVPRLKKAFKKKATVGGILSAKYEEDDGKYNVWNIPTSKLSFLAYSARELWPPLKPAEIVRKYVNARVIPQARATNEVWSSIYTVAKDICDYFAKEIELGNY